MKIIMLGAPGSGRKTQAQLLANKFDIADISVGHLLRSAIKNQTIAGKKAKELMYTGKLVPDEIILEVIKKRLRKKDAAKGFVLNGYPNNISQAEALDKLLAKIDRSVDYTFFLDVSNDTVIRRLTGRRSCLKCGKKVNVSYEPPLKPETCDDCGGILMQRADDNPQSILELLKIYNAQTKPLAEFYRQLGKNISIDGNLVVKSIFKKIMAELKKTKKRKPKKKTSNKIAKKTPQKAPKKLKENKRKPKNSSKKKVKK